MEVLVHIHCRWRLSSLGLLIVFNLVFTTLCFICCFFFGKGDLVKLPSNPNSSLGQSSSSSSPSSSSTSFSYSSSWSSSCPFFSSSLSSSTNLASWSMPSPISTLHDYCFFDEVTLEALQSNTSTSTCIFSSKLLPKLFLSRIAMVDGAFIFLELLDWFYLFFCFCTSKVDVDFPLNPFLFLDFEATIDSKWETFIITSSPSQPIFFLWQFHCYRIITICCFYNEQGNR